MRPGRPKWHTHNWQMRFRGRERTEVPETLKPYTNMAWSMIRYWACIRGSKIKHTHKWIPYFTEGFEGKRIVQAEKVIITASGFYPERV